MLLSGWMTFGFIVSFSSPSCYDFVEIVLVVYASPNVFWLLCGLFMLYLRYFAHFVDFWFRKHIQALKHAPEGDRLSGLQSEGAACTQASFLHA